jgi:hypothetical protein
MMIKFKHTNLSNTQLISKRGLLILQNTYLYTKTYLNITSNISNPIMRIGLDFKSAQFDQGRGEAEDWIKMRGLEI